jgi:hypothetical protein
MGINDANDRGSFEAANNYFVAPADRTCLFGADAPLQGQRQRNSPNGRVARAEGHHGNPRLLGAISGTHVALAVTIYARLDDWKRGRR